MRRRGILLYCGAEVRSRHWYRHAHILAVTQLYAGRKLSFAMSAFLRAAIGCGCLLWHGLRLAHGDTVEGLESIEIVLPAVAFRHLHHLHVDGLAARGVEARVVGVHHTIFRRTP